jgi:large subunit ribosomal protein L22
MRLVADLVRGQKVERALNILRFSSKSFKKIRETVVICNQQLAAKNADANIEEAGLFVKEIRVDGGMMLKRLRPAPQGRAHRIRKRSNHVTIVLGQLITHKAINKQYGTKDKSNWKSTWYHQRMGF